MDEQWRPIPGFEDCYSVSDLGRIRSEERIIPRPRPPGWRRVRERIIKLPARHGLRRPFVTLHRDGTRTYRRVDEIVAEVFGESA